MPSECSADTYRSLSEAFSRHDLLRPMRRSLYEEGEQLSLDVTGTLPARPARVRLTVEKFVGGGFAGQVYRVRLHAVDAPEGEILNLPVGGPYAMKILVPPSRRARIFRNLIYFLGFQGPFALQTNPAAVRAAALWQKFIRRAAALRFGSEAAVTDVLATFVDPGIGSCGEISQWLDGRTWRHELDNHLDELKKWIRGRAMDAAKLGSPEYRSKRQFMAELVELLHEMGACELARQYEWWTCKSQPNVLKRLDTEDDPEGGLTAVDFRAGLALLPFLPMCPTDVRLILTGIARGSWVQFDRGDLDKLTRFVEEHSEHFADMHGALDELIRAEEVYRSSQIDITHNHVRLLYSRKLWSQIFSGAVTGWQVRNIVDDSCAAVLSRSKLLTVLFTLVGMLRCLLPLGAAAAFIAAWARGVMSWPLAGGLACAAVIGPLAARIIRRLWGRADYRRHYGRMLSSFSYFRRAFRGRMLEKIISWCRSGRLGDERALKLAERPVRFLLHLPLSILPAFLHRMLTDMRYAAEKLAYVFVRPVRLYFNAEARRQWLREMVEDGHTERLLTDQERDKILSRIGEPFIQKYLLSLVVHLCTLPVTQIVSVAVAYWVGANYGDNLAQKSWLFGGVLVLFQVTPISPGSILRGLYVVGLVIKERNYKDYKVALWLGFVKYIGYLAFPIQMAYEYPILSRFMAARWATGIIHHVPVFGERGALLEHGVFNLFFNRLITIQRKRREKRAAKATDAHQ